MKKILATLFLVFVMFFGCKKQANDIEYHRNESRFVVVDRTSNWIVVYDKETLVMYSVSRGGYNNGNFTLLVDSIGKPLLWKGGEQ